MGADPSRIIDREGFGEELSRLRASAGLTVRQLAVQVGVPSATVGGYLSARHLPSAGQVAVVRALLAECGVTDAAAIQAWMLALARARSASDGRSSQRRRS